MSLFYKLRGWESREVDGGAVIQTQVCLIREKKKNYETAFATQTVSRKESFASVGLVWVKIWQELKVEVRVLLSLTRFVRAKESSRQRSGPRGFWGGASTLMTTMDFCKPWIFVQEPFWQTGGTYRPGLRAVFLNALNEICQISRKANYIFKSY